MGPISLHSSRHGVLRLLALIALAFAAAASAQEHPQLPQATRWYASADPQTGQTVFELTFDQPFDFSSGDGLQFWIADSGNATRRVYGVLFGDIPLTSERVIEFRRAVEQGLADIVEPRLYDWEPGPDEIAAIGGWGEIVGSVPFSLDGTAFSMSLPIAATGEHFVYDGMLTKNGAADQYFDGVSGVVGRPPPVPELATWAQLLAGLVALGATVSNVASRGS